MAAIPLSKDSRTITIIWYLISLLLISVLTATLPVKLINSLAPYSDLVIWIIFMLEVYLTFLFVAFKWRDYRYAVAPYKSDNTIRQLLEEEVERFHSFYVSILESYEKEYGRS